MVNFPFTYEIIWSTRRKTLGLSITRAGKVLLRAPVGMSETSACDFLREKQAWVLKHLQRLPDQSAAIERAASQYQEGELLWFLGQQIPLTFQRQSQKLQEAGFYVPVSATLPQAERYQAVFQELGRRAVDYFDSELDRWMPVFQEYGCQRPYCTIRWMKGRWGSMSTRNRLSLNGFLIQTPPECVEFVVVHELCHMLHPNHGKAFYALQEELLPDWQKRQQQIRRFEPLVLPL